MKSGEVAKIDCPNDLDLGSGVHNNYHGNFNQRWIKGQTDFDTEYKYNVLECGTDPEHFKREMLEEMSHSYPFYLLSKED